MDDASPLFVDTSFVLALVNARDQRHIEAVQWQARLDSTRRRLVTTELVLVEIADGLAHDRFRRQAIDVIDAFRFETRAEIVRSIDFFAAALAHYRSRLDKEWSLTDCASFVVMERRHLISALTSDHHFRQAGFVPLLLDQPDRSTERPLRPRDALQPIELGVVVGLVHRHVADEGDAGRIGRPRPLHSRG